MNKLYLTSLLLLSIGVLTGCHYCEPLLLIAAGYGVLQLAFRQLDTKPDHHTPEQPIHSI